MLNSTLIPPLIRKLRLLIGLFVAAIQVEATMLPAEYFEQEHLEEP